MSLDSESAGLFGSFAILPIVWEYFKAAGAYWWFVFVGVLIPLPDIWKHFHCQSGFVGQQAYFACSLLNSSLTEIRQLT